MHQPTPTRCQPWCTEHHNDGPGYCQRPARGFAGAFLSSTPDGPMVFAYGAREELPLDVAEAYGRALLDLVATARTAVLA
ncbi:hypothetical protein [Planobispora rosea]|uniref:hypothetical protein n=1 Tax=Planobispora rosea TaxID=35762 RepID=UPI00114CC611|nr:hypothetical protein [Planobispora rosea]